MSLEIEDIVKRISFSIPYRSYSNKKASSRKSSGKKTNYLTR